MIRVRLWGHTYYDDMDLDEAVTPPLKGNSGEGDILELHRHMREMAQLSGKLLVLLVDKGVITAEEAVLMVRPGVQVSILEEDE